MMGFVEAAKLEQAKQKILTVLTFLERRLDNRPYFGSNLLTLAELVAGTSVPQLPSLGVAVG